MKSVYKLYRDRLVEMTGRSRSLYSRSVSKRHSYNLGRLLDGDAAGAQAFIQFLYSSKGNFPLFNAAQTDSLIRALNLPEPPTPEIIKKLTEREGRMMERGWKE
jgi:hypothetical protein